MKILVTGGAGFIGSHIVDYLLEKNIQVRVIDNLITGKRSNIETYLTNPNFEFIQGDITDLVQMKKACLGIDAICHQAAYTSVPGSVENPVISHDTNVNGFLNVLLVAKENNIKRIVYASSSAVYGDNTIQPNVEDKIGNQLSPYAVTKYINELYAKNFTNLYGLECIGLRYFNVFGPRQEPNSAYAAVIPKFIDTLKCRGQATIFGDGSFTRDFVYVKSVAHANYLALTTNNELCFGAAFNIGSNKSITILQTYNQIKKILNVDVEPIFKEERKGDVAHSRANILKAMEMLFYRPIVEFNDALAATIEAA